MVESDKGTDVQKKTVHDLAHQVLPMVQYVIMM